MITHTAARFAGFVTLLLLLDLCVAEAAGELPRAEPKDVGMRGEHLQLVDTLVQEGLEQDRMPGCVITVGRQGKIIFQKAYGFRQLEPTPVAMTTDTVFDMASITKPVATATSIMILLERGQIRLRDKVSTYIPEFANGGKESVSVTQLLTHQAGFVPDNAVEDYQQGREQAFQNIYALETYYPPGTRFVYSDVGFILLDDLIQRQSGQTVAEFAQHHIFRPLGMEDTQFLPSEAMRQRSATTEQRDDAWLQGRVHDPRAHWMGGVAGHAGLFSTADDLAVYAQMMLNGGRFGGRRILSQATVDVMTRSYSIVEGEKVSIRGLGWDKLTGYSSNRAENFSPDAFGHGGFTGTVLWMDPQQELFFIFLSNRVHPNGKGSVNRLAGRIATVVVSSIDDDASQPLPAAESSLSHPQAPSAAPTDSQSSSRRRSQPSPLDVEAGIDVLQADSFRVLAGQRVGLITNQTGISREGVPTVDVLRESRQVDLRALFSPEHGLAGKLDQSVIADSVDGHQIPIYSLYGSTRQPTEAQLAQLDCLVFDIQDIGCRFYTYISTLGLAMQAAAKHGRRFVVLDRPNPINGRDVGGPLLDEGSESFVGFHTLPIRHGMTVGELAKMFRSELELDLDLHVVACTSWQRSMYFDETGLRWVNPSPNMRSIKQALLYPGVGLWETTNLSVGRGTDTPFEIVGAPWMDGMALARLLNQAELPGVAFTPMSFTPQASKFAHQRCHGVYLSITNRDQLDPLRLGLTLATSIWKLHPEQWQLADSARLLNHQATRKALRQGGSASDIFASWEPELETFRVRRQRYLIYDD